MTGLISPKCMSELGGRLLLFRELLFLIGVTEADQGETTANAETMVNKADQGIKADQGQSGILA
jgi:hypothetical protein